MQFVEWFVCFSILSFQEKHYVLICVLSSSVLDHYPFCAADATLGTLMVCLMNIGSIVWQALHGLPLVCFVNYK